LNEHTAAIHNGAPIERRAPRTEQSVSISVASRITGVEVHTLRYWEKEFSGFLEPIRTDGGQRRYRPEDIQTVFLIKRLLRDDMFSIAGARRHLAHTARAA
jgi:DNA-binding transcriptional MerR regulator